MPRATILLPENFIFKTELQVRITDINYGGHVGNDTILAYLQEGRLRFLAHNGFSEKNVEGYGIIMADAEIIYKSQIYYGMTLLLEIALADPGKRACDIIYRISIKETGKEAVRAKTRIAFFDYVKNSTVAIPENFRNLFFQPA